MHASQVRPSSILVVVSALPWFLTACARPQSAPSVNQETFVCSDQTVGVDTVDGTSPKDVYLCKGYTMTWLPNGNKFTVHFPKKYPFEGAPQDFTNNPQKPNDPVTSPPAKYAGSLVVYHYDMTVNGQPVPDPQVIGGGH